MDTRVAVISIIVEQEDAIEELNTLLHETVHCRQDGHPVSTEGDQHYQYCH